MPQLSHQYHCVNDANCYAHWTTVQGLQYQYKYASVGAAIVWSWCFLLCENRCNEHPRLATCQDRTQLVEQRSYLTCNLNLFSFFFCFSHLLFQRALTLFSHLFWLLSNFKPVPHFWSPSVHIHFTARSEKHARLVQWDHSLWSGFIVDASHSPPPGPLSAAPSPLDLSL